MSFLRHFPLGTRLPGGLHSVVCSLPTMQDVIGYEEKRPEVTSKMTTGYPRFVTHPLIVQVANAIAAELKWKSVRPFLTPELKAAEALLKYAGAGRVVEHAGLHAVLLPDDQAVHDRGRAFLQHTGSGLSSREAEDWLFRHRLISHVERDELFNGSPEAADTVIRTKLHGIYGTRGVEDIYLCRGGMNAFYAAYQAASAVQAARGRKLWVQLGWLYLDTMRVLEKFHAPGYGPAQFYNVFDLSALEHLITDRGQEIAGIVAEIPNNPLVQTCDLPRLRELADRCGAMLLLDPTIASPHNVNILPYSDLHINSLTKYAGSAGDVMIGALAINSRQPHAGALHHAVKPWVLAPYWRDTARLAAVIHNYGPVVNAINRNTPQIVEFLLTHPSVRDVYWAAHPHSRKNFERIIHEDGGYGSIITFTLRKPLVDFYDRARVVKGPSFGLNFTLMCPFMFLAHYDLVSSPRGCDYLRDLGLDPSLIRLSIGTEPASAIIEALREGLD